MIKKFILSLIVVLLGSSIVNGQEVVKQCGWYEAKEAFLDAHPEAKEEIELAIKISEAENSLFNPMNKMTPDTVIIPVVFHIVHNNGTENVSDQVVYDAVEQMNLDYMANNDDIDDVVSDFTNSIGNPMIIFRLAQYDPDGNCTNGITRTVSDLTYTGGDDLKYTSLGGIDGWDRASYLNIWVSRVAFDNGDPNSVTLGYSQYPVWVNNYPADDGIVVRSDAIGTNERTLTHEAAHWLNIKHTWGDSNEPGLASNCGVDDDVADTPNTIGHFGGCDLSEITCGSLDNIQNYMDYGSCSAMFTQGQADRMIAALNSSTAQRNQLWTNANLSETGVLEGPLLCSSEFEADNVRICSGQEVAFTNTSYSGDTEWNWVFEGGTPATSTEENPVVVYNTPGEYDVSLTVGNGIDEVSETKVAYISVLPDLGHATPYVEGFENESEFPNENWIITSTDQNRYWEITDLASSSGSNSAVLKNYYQSADDKDELESNPIDLSSLDNVAITFKYAYAKRHNDDDDVLRLKVTRTCGNTWNTRETLRATNNTLVTAVNHLGYFTPEDDEWQEAYLDNITEQYLVENFRMKFEFTAGEGNNVYIDDINIFDPTTVGINEVNKAALKFSVYPNPVEDELSISFNLLHSSDVTGEVFDISGRKITTLFSKSFQLGKTQMNFNTSDWNAGVYLVRISLEGEMFIEKVIKN
jgi:PKD repeat protein